MIYIPSNHYWIVAGDETRVYSSALAAYVTLPNAGYTAWLAEGRLPTRIASEVELWQVLAQQAPAGLSPAQALLLYSTAKNLISANDAVSVKEKSSFLVLLDALNRQSRQYRDLLAAIAAASSLANLQTRVAAISPVEPARTAAEFRTAIANKIDAGEANG